MSSYQTALTISTVIKNIDSKTYLLPSIQREFVWSTKQIEKLFDSIMMDYPINSFLFWKVPKDKANEFKFYEFLRNYHQKDGRHNPKADTNGSDDIIAILDGQQRMTSLYIGLKGTYAYKLSYKRWDNPQAYPKRKLYLNLLTANEETDSTYKFLFLTDAEVKEANSAVDANEQAVDFWFPVGEILNFKQEYEVNTYLIKNKLTSHSDPNKAMFANEALFKLFTAIHRKETISYYLEESTELDKVLSIFIRVNSGGTPLSYSDLLLSFATAQWQDKDARESINEIVDELNEIGRGFNLTKDMVLKTCLVLGDFPDIAYKVDNFNNTNMLVIEQKWDDITTSLRLAVELIASFGFSRENIQSNSALIPIAYYIQTIGNASNFVDSSAYEEDRKKIKKWFIASQLLHAFSSAPDGFLKPLREIILKNPGGFPYQQIDEKFKGTNRDISFSDDSINNLLYTKCGSGDILLVMSILYPWADLKNHFHIDHMFPKSLFTRKRIQKLGVPDNQADFYIDNVNYIGNLQLLEELPNKEKNNTEFKTWLEQNYADADKLKAYREKHYIPDVGVEFTNFEEFFLEREKLLVKALKAALI
ncbi:DUF262 domain-containing protein [Oribacterium sinus]|jgi:hypothetical protein|uniref:DUF262 domain-containing protein n=1 Tax=Oribacterium sinus TaxID=237576 RepID=UPI0028E46EED|nr:DUF262 domain-containing protein [Oribacterium sinus]